MGRKMKITKKRKTGKFEITDIERNEIDELYAALLDHFMKYEKKNKINGDYEMPLKRMDRMIDQFERKVK